RARLPGVVLAEKVAVNKSWKLTAAFAALFVALSAAYFFSSPPATTPMKELDPRVLEGLASEQISKIEVDRKGTILAFEKTTDRVGEHWRMAGPSSHPAETAMVQQMLFGLDRFLKAGALEPGKPETAPDVTGLAEPRLSVTFTSAGRREVLRFGKAPVNN